MKKDNKQRLFEVMERLNPDFKQDKPKLILPVGISGSGKSTWIKSQTDPNTIVISPDDIRRELTGNISDQTKNAEVFQIAHKRVADALNAGKNVIFDATNIKSRDRKSLMDYMKVHVDKSIEGLAKVFSVDPEIAKQRVKKDIEAGVDRSNVPDWAIDKQYRIFVDDMNSIELDGFKIIDNINEQNLNKSKLILAKNEIKKIDPRFDIEVESAGGKKYWLVDKSNLNNREIISFYNESFSSINQYTDEELNSMIEKFKKWGTNYLQTKL